MTGRENRPALRQRRLARVADGKAGGIDARRPITSRQLAALIGVSQSTVSRAFTPRSSISPDLRAHVLNTARQLGYQPNAIASMLTKQRTDMVGIVVSDMRNPFYPVLIERLTQGLQRIGLQCLLFNVTPGANVEEQLNAIRTYNLDAVVVVAATVLSESAVAWAAEGRRAILVNRQSLEDITTVCCDNAAGARAIVDHLHAVGRRRIGYVAGLTKSAVAVERQTACINRIAELGMQFVGSASQGVYSYEAGWRSALELLPAKPDAIFFASDILALGGSDALRQAAGITIPDDIAVAGFDDIAMASWPHYALTTYRQPIDNIVATTVELLSPQADAMAVHRLLPGELVVRASTVGAG